MDALASRILDHLALVDAQRTLRARDRELDRQVRAVKAYQQRRFATTYRDLLEHRRYGPAARFFLDELYGPEDFSSRDRQFARVVPSLGRLLPAELVSVVESLGELHALSEQLDTRMAQASVGSAPFDRDAYCRAWRTTDGRAERSRQLALTLHIGRALERHTSSAVLRHSLRLMRGPAKAAGLAELQTFLERGFTAFAEMKGAAEFLALVEHRESTLIERLFADPGTSQCAGDSTLDLP